MIDYFDLSPKDKILFALAVLTDFREPKEIAACIDATVDFFGAKKEEGFIYPKKPGARAIGNTMSKMLVTRYEKQTGFLLEMKKNGKKHAYNGGKFTVDTRLSALMLLLLWSVYNARNRSLLYEDAEKIAENDREFIHNLVKNDSAGPYIFELSDEIAKEGLAAPALKDKFHSILKADYLRRKDRTLIEPTGRFSQEKSYFEALAYLLPLLKEHLVKINFIQN